MTTDDTTQICRCGNPTREGRYFCEDIWRNFWAKVNKTETCWLWTGASNQYGYGNFGLHKTTKRSHRLAYEWLVGPVPDGLVLDHLCRVRACCNPAHLEPVTQRQNLRRGIGPNGTKASQTSCVHGHEFTPENTSIKINGCRECRACSSRRSSEKWQRTKAKNKAERSAA